MAPPFSPSLTPPRSHPISPSSSDDDDDAMPSVGIKLYSVLFKLLLRHRLHHLPGSGSSSGGGGGGGAAAAGGNPFGVSSRPDEPAVPANPSFAAADGVATKDIHIDPLTSLSVRIFLPDPSLFAPSPHQHPPLRRNSFPAPPPSAAAPDLSRRASFGAAAYRGYLPALDGGGGRGRAAAARRLPLVVQFHGGAFVSGSADSAANDLFCRRIARHCEAIVIAVGYRLAPESRYPAAFEDGLKVLNWLAKQANLAECSKSMGSIRLGAGGGAGAVTAKAGVQRYIVDAFGASLVEPWLAAHADVSRCVLLGASCGANIADYVARKAVEAGKLLDPVKVVAQYLEGPAIEVYAPDFDCGRGARLDEGPRNRLLRGARKVNVDAPVLEYKDAVHEFATLDILLKTPQAQACAEDIAIWSRSIYLLAT
ncbi:putative carboxylesterase 16 [Ananas comosus]|uniref:Putative carboxylesterase 16 n=1 Tax=Ananas comosus TaxID=4615 RepID=A0A199W9M3_ANACO|nr:putative carboxylesterase 16 [Ananas comosus]